MSNGGIVECGPSVPESDDADTQEGGGSVVGEEGSEMLLERKSGVTLSSSFDSGRRYMRSDRTGRLDMTQKRIRVANPDVYVEVRSEYAGRTTGLN